MRCTVPALLGLFLGVVCVAPAAADRLVTTSGVSFDGTFLGLETRTGTDGPSDMVKFKVGGGIMRIPVVSVAKILDDDGQPLNLAESETRQDQGQLEHSETAELIQDAMEEANALRLEKRWTEALELYQHVLAVDPNHVRARYFAAMLLYMTGDGARARQEMLRVIRQDPRNADAHGIFGGWAFEDGDTKSALTHYRRQTELQPDNADAWCVLAAVLMSEFYVEEAGATRRLEEIVGHLRKALRLNPEHQQAMSMLALTSEIEVAVAEREHQPRTTSSARGAADRLIQKYGGNGRKITRPFRTSGPWEVQWQNDGAGFAIWLHASDGERLDLLANEASAGSGSSFVPTAGSYYLDISGSDLWIVRVVEIE